MVHLHVHSVCSMINGAAEPEALVRRAKELGMRALALTDTGNLFGAHRFVRLCRDAGIRPILGAELTVTDGESAPDGEPDGGALVLLAKNADGFANLVRLVSLAHKDGERLRPTVSFDRLLAHSGSLFCLSGGYEGRIPQLLAAGDADAARDEAKKLHAAFGENFFIELTPNPDGAAVSADAARRRVKELMQLAESLGIPAVAANDVRCVTRAELAAYALLHSDRTNRTPEDELEVCRQSRPWLLSAEEMADALPDAPEAVALTEIIAAQTEDYSLALQVRLPDPVLPAGFAPELPDEEALRREFRYFDRLGGTDAVRRLKRDSDLLEKTVLERARTRWPGDTLTPTVRARLAYELDTMKQLGCAGYVLLMAETAALARDTGALLGPGRGDALGSAVCYALGITRADPIRFGLDFEPFLNPDIPDGARLPILPEIPLTVNPAARPALLEALEERFGADSLCAAAELHRIPEARALRMAARVLGADPVRAERLAENGPDATGGDPEADRLWRLARPLSDICCSVGEHPSRLAVSVGPLTDTVPVLPSGYGGFVTAQYDADGLKDSGLFTFDLVSMPLLGLLKDTQDFVESAGGGTRDSCALPLNDDAAFRLFADGGTADLPLFDGDFMRSVLGMLRPDTFEELVTLAALVRPASQEACGAYLNCRLTGTVRKTGDPCLDAAFADTCGVPAFREQLTDALRRLGRFSAAEAETLARALAGSDPTEARARCRRAGIADPLQDELAAGLRTALPKPRAVTYALLGYALAWFKARFPTEYTNARLFA